MSHHHAPPLRRYRGPVLLAIAILTALAALAAVSLGTLDLPLEAQARIILAKLGMVGKESAGFTAIQEAVFWNLRLPRMLLGMLVGLGLGLAGAALQGIFRNPLADPGLIGVSSGGALGAVLVIVFGAALSESAGSGPVPTWLLPLGALAGGVGTTFLVYAISRLGGRSHMATMLLAGVAINALAGAIVGFAVYASDNDQLRLFTFWSLGSLGQADWQRLGLVALLTLPAALLLPRFSRHLNVMMLGEAEAHHLGIRVARVRRLIIALSAIMVSAGVAVCGIIGFIGLVAPHLVRLLLGPDHRWLLPGSALTGGAILLAADSFARTVAAPAELPIGILTALLGAPFFLWLLVASQRTGQHT